MIFGSEIFKLLKDLDDYFEMNIILTEEIIYNFFFTQK